MRFILRNMSVESEINQSEPSPPYLQRVDLPDYPHEFEYPEGALFYFLRPQEWPQLMRLAGQYGWRPVRDYCDFFRNTGYDFTVLARDDVGKLANALERALPSIPSDQSDRPNLRQMMRKLAGDPRFTYRGQRLRLSNFIDFLQAGDQEDGLDSRIWLYDWTNRP